MIPGMKKPYLQFIFFICLIALTTGALNITSDAKAAPISAAEKERLQNELDEIEKQIKAFEDELKATQGEKKTLERAISKLRNQESSLRLQVKSTDLKIKDIDKKLSVTETDIVKTQTKNQKLKTQLAEIVRLMNRKDQEILLESLSAKDGLSEVAQNVQSYSTLFYMLQDIVSETKAINEDLKKQQDALENQQEDAKKLLEIKAGQQAALKGTLSEQSALLSATKGKESSFQEILTDSRKRAAEIRNRIYETVGGGSQVTFEQAVQIAEYASAQTGIRAPFLLAIITQESNLGKNVGTCNRAGDPPHKSWKAVMKPTRDQEPFKIITEELGLDIDTTPVSCPMYQNGKQFGYGGAMGPAQFIPSTWMAYRSKVAAITGKPANPWDIKDAMLASAVKLTNDGADGSYDGEWRAAMKYFAGSVKLKYRFYGDNVMKTTQRYEAEMEAIK